MALIFAWSGKVGETNSEQRGQHFMIYIFVSLCIGCWCGAAPNVWHIFFLLHSKNALLCINCVFLETMQMNWMIVKSVEHLMSFQSINTKRSIVFWHLKWSCPLFIHSITKCPIYHHFFFFRGGEGNGGDSFSSPLRHHWFWDKVRPDKYNLICTKRLSSLMEFNASFNFLYQLQCYSSCLPLLVAWRWMNWLSFSFSLVRVHK